MSGHYTLTELVHVATFQYSDLCFSGLNQPVLSSSLGVGPKPPSTHEKHGRLHLLKYGKVASVENPSVLFRVGQSSTWMEKPG